MSDQELLELKGWGHQLLNVYIDVAKISRDQAYVALSRQIGLPRADAHFAKMGPETTVRAVKALRLMIKRRNQKGRQKTSKNTNMYREWNKSLKGQKTALTQAEMKEALKQLKKPWYVVALRYLRRIL